MVTNATIKKGYKQTELGVIPEDWEVLELGELNAEKFPALDPQVFKDELFEYYSIPDYQEYKRPSFVLGKTIQSSKVLFKNKTILFGRLNPRVEKVWLVESLSKKRKIGSGEWITILPDNANHISKYIYYLEWSKYVMPIAKENVSGTTPSRQRIISSFFYKIKVPIPSDPKEQTAIATVLSDTDALIEHLEKLIAKKKAIKKGTMQQLFTGKKRLPGFNGEWEVKKLGEIGETYGGLSAKTKSDFDKGDYPYIPFMNIMSNPVIDLQYFDYVNIRSDEKQNKAIKGDLFFNGSSETPEEVGMCSVLQADIPSLYLNSFCFGFRLNKNLKTDGLYLSYFFRSPIGRHLIFSLAQGATRYNLSKINFMSLEIPYPEPTEQTAIATILSDMDAELESLKKKRDKYAMLKQGMMQQLLTGRIRIYANN